MKKIIITLFSLMACFVFEAFSETHHKMNILVYPFEVSGGDKYSWIGAGLTDTVISDLNGMPDIYVFSDADRKKALQEISLGMTGFIKESEIVKVGKVMGATMIFTGSVQTSGVKIRVNAKLINIETTRIEKSVKLDGTVDAIFDLQDKVVLSLMNNNSKSYDSHSSNKSIADFSEPQKTRPKEGVYELYSKGLELNDTKPRKALEYYLKALALDPEYIDALLKTGSLYDDLKEFEEALNYLSKARSILDKRGEMNSAEYAEILNNIGVVYRDMSDYENALECYSKSQKIRENLNIANTANFAETSSNIGIVYVDTGKYDEAIVCYLKSKKIFDSIGFQNSSKYAILINNIGGVYWIKGDNDMALKYYLKSREIRDKLELQVTPGYAYLMNNIGGVHWKKGDNTKAVECYEKSLEIRNLLGLQNTESYSVLLNNIALTYHKRLKDPCKGAEYMKRCVEIDKKNNFIRLPSDIKDYKEMQEACRVK